MRITDDCLRRQWWSEENTYFQGVASEELNEGLRISFGCLNESDYEDFMRVLEDLVRDNELEARIRAKNKAADEERKRLAAIKAYKDAQRYWSEQQVSRSLHFLRRIQLFVCLSLHTHMSRRVVLCKI